MRSLWPDDRDLAPHAGELGHLAVRVVVQTGRIVAASLLGLVMSSGIALALPAPILGTWTTEDGSSRIAFEPCGDKVCGRVAWLREPNDPETGRPLADKNNPEAALRARPILGLPIFLGLRPDDGQWSGKVYNADDGKTYEVTVKRKAPDKLEVEGCMLAVLCKGETWTRGE